MFKTLKKAHMMVLWEKYTYHLRENQGLMREDTACANRQYLASHQMNLKLSTAVTKQK